MRNEKKIKCKSLKDCSMVENESEEVGQHVLLAQVLFWSSTSLLYALYALYSFSSFSLLNHAAPLQP